MPAIYKDTKYSSDGELYFSWWLDELLEAELITRYEYEKQSFTLASKRKIKFLDIEDKIEKCTYTPDFWVFATLDQYKKLTQLGIGLLPYDLDSSITPELCFIVEIKPKYDFQNKNQLAKVKIKWLYYSHNIYVNLVYTAPDLFKTTFTPKEYLLTDTKKRERKIEWDVVLLKDKLIK